MEKYGFVYIWYDRKHKRYYIGSHWGKEDDGYICSSRWMRKSYKRRQQDFRRRVISKVYTNRKDLLVEEQRYLNMIKPTEIKIRYYNLTLSIKNPWFINEDKLKTVGQKISKSQKANPNFGKWNVGRKVSEEERKRISESTSSAMKQHYKNNPRSEETCRKISENSKRLQAEGKIGIRGRKHKPDTIEKMKNNNAMNNPIHVEKVKASKQGIRWLKSGEIRKMAVPGTDKYKNLISQGFTLI